MKYSPFMTCREASALISARFDRELGPLERAALGFHLRICTACPRVVAQFERMREATRAWKTELEAES